MYQVFDNGQPADYGHYDVPKSWGSSKFKIYQQAEDYARKWLGDFYSGVTLKPNKRIDYSGYGDYIEIREIK